MMSPRQPMLLAGRRHPPDDRGFSLIELTIVLLIIAILLAVAIPTYLSARDRAENRAAQENLAQLEAAAQAIYSRTASYPFTTATEMADDLSSNDPDLVVFSSYTDSEAVGPGYVIVGNGNQWLEMGTRAPDGTCWWIFNVWPGSSALADESSSTGVSQPGVYYGASRGQSDCPIVYKPASGWQNSFAAASAA